MKKIKSKLNQESRLKQDNNAIQGFFDYMKRYTGEFFIFGYFPDNGLGYFSTRQKEKLFFKDWADEIISSDAAFGLLIQFLKGTLASFLDRGVKGFEYIDQIRDMVASLYEYDDRLKN